MLSQVQTAQGGNMTLQTLQSNTQNTATPLFPNVAQGDIAAELEQPMQILQIKENETIFKLGEVPQGIYLVKTGCVKLMSKRDQIRGRIGGNDHIVKLVGPGEFFGFKATMINSQHNISAKAAKPSEVWVYRKELITNILSGPNTIFKMVLNQAIKDLEQHETTNKLHYLASVQERIAFELLKIADRFGVSTPNGISINLKMTRSELAQLAGTINESLSRHLTEMKNEGIIDLRGREILIKDREALTRKL